jgi:hypothetical protein
MGTQYISEYLRKKCSGQLQELFSLSGNPMKELSESMAAYKALSKVKDTRDENYACICVGDGSLCLTGALFAFMTKRKVYSIDPLINEGRFTAWMSRENAERISMLKLKYQEAAPLIGGLETAYDLVCVHAHVELEDLVSRFPRWRYLYTNPCCRPLEQTFSPQFQYGRKIQTVLAGRDENILSEKNEVYVYKNMETQ